MATLKQKMQGLRDEMEKYRDMYEDKCKETEEERAKRSSIELEIDTLQRRLRLVEDENEQTMSRLQLATEKLSELTSHADESERARRALENKNNFDEDKMSELEQSSKDAREAANEAERKLNENSRKIVMVESELERAEERADRAEAKVKELEEQLINTNSHLKSLEFSEGKLSEREETYEATIRDLAARLKEAESRASEAERSAGKLQRDVDRLEEDLEQAKQQHKALRDEMETCFSEIQSI